MARRSAAGVSSTIVAAVVVAVVLVAGIGYYVLNTGGPAGSQASHPGTVTTGQAPPINFTKAYLAHVFNFGNKTTCSFSAAGCVYSYSVLNDYTNQSLVVWRGGNSTYLASGQFQGLNNIQSLYQRVASAAPTMNFKVQTITATGSQLTVTMGVSGVGNYIGKYSGTINASATYTYSGGSWSISKEVWDFTTLTAQNTNGYQPYVSNYASR